MLKMKRKGKKKKKNNNEKNTTTNHQTQKYKKNPKPAPNKTKKPLLCSPLGTESSCPLALSWASPAFLLLGANKQPGLGVRLQGAGGCRWPGRSSPCGGTAPLCTGASKGREVTRGFRGGCGGCHHAPWPAEVQGAGGRGAQLGGGGPGRREGADGQAEAADEETVLPGVGSPGTGTALGQPDPRGAAGGRAEPRAPRGRAGRQRMRLCHHGGGSGVAQDGAAGDAGCRPAPGAAADAPAGAAAPAEGGAGLPPAQGDAGRRYLRPRRLRGRLGPALQHPTQGRLPALHAAQAHRRHPHEHQLPTVLPLLSTAGPHGQPWVHPDPAGLKHPSQNASGTVELLPGLRSLGAGGAEPWCCQPCCGDNAVPQ